MESSAEVGIMEKSWENYKLVNKAESTAIDDAYLKQTGQLRFQTQIGNTIKVYTANFKNGKNTAPSTNQ